MRLRTLASLILVTMGSLQADDLQQIANNMAVKSPSAETKKLQLPRASGAHVRLLGADYEQIIDKAGNINHPMSDTAVRVSFEVSKDGRKVTSRDYEITVPAKSKAA